MRNVGEQPRNIIAGKYEIYQPNSPDVNTMLLEITYASIIMIVKFDGYGS